MLGNTTSPPVKLPRGMTKVYDFTLLVLSVWHEKLCPLDSAKQKKEPPKSTGHCLMSSESRAMFLSLILEAAL